MNRLGVPLPSYHAVTAGRRPRATLLRGGRADLEEQKIYILYIIYTHLSGTNIIQHDIHKLRILLLMMPNTDTEYLSNTMLIYSHFFS